MSESAPASQRIHAIDVLRGVAVLGILLMNIQSFAMPASAYSYPWSWGDMSGSNAAVYYACHVLADGKFITIFAMLFGAGILLQQAKYADSPLGTKIHYRRMFGLLAFGLFHAYFIWYGDILFTYAVLGMIVFLLRRAPVNVQLILAGLLFAAGITLNVVIGLALRYVDFHTAATVALEFNPAHETQLAEIAAYRGSFGQQFSERFVVALLSQSYILVTFCLPIVTGLMLMGMALLRTGFFYFAWRRRTYVVLATIGTLIGWAMSGAGLIMDERTGRDPILSVEVWHYLNILGTLPAALGYSSIVLLAVNGGWRLAPLAAVGRTAFSCYLLQSVLCTLIFYGHGLGAFGKVNRVGQLAIVVGVWVVIVTFAWFWTRRFRYGPAEWVWRGLTYGFDEVRSARGKSV